MARSWKSPHKFKDEALGMGDIKPKMIKLHNRRVCLTKISNPDNHKQYCWHVGFVNFVPNAEEFKGKRLRDCVRITEFVLSRDGLKAFKTLISAFEKEGL